MTKNEMLEKYGDVKLKFFRYYKYTFTFSALLEDNSHLIVNIGGDSSDIYRLDVEADYEETINSSLDPISVEIWDGNKLVDSYYE